MRLVLVPLSLLASAGCSLIYNPSNIDKVDGDGGVLDMEIIVDADPNALSLTRVRPNMLIEGQGVGGSRPAMIVIQGDNFVEGAIIEVVQHEDGMPHPSITIDTANVEVDGNHKYVVVPVALAIDPNMGDIRLDLKVTQPTPTGMATQMITTSGGDDEPALILRGLPEHTEGPLAINTDTTPEAVFSVVTASAITYTGSNPLIVRSMSSLTVTDPLAVNANGQNPGLAGGRGGNGGPLTTGGSDGAGICPGRGGQGSTLGAGAAGTAGTLGTSCMAANPAVPDLRANVSGGGGGSGGGTLHAGAAGGGGGGNVELSADGDLSVGDISARGAAGGNAGAAGGSGGTILLRSRGAFTTGVVTTEGGGTSLKGGVGRIRFDNPSANTTLTGTGAIYRGPTLLSTTPLVVRTPRPALTIIGQPGASVRVTIDGFIEAGEAAGMPGSRSPINLGTGATGTNNFTFEDDQPGLYRGVNTVCVEVDGAVGGRGESRNCTQITYMLPQP